MPVLKNGELARRQTTEEILRVVQVGDVVECLLHPSGSRTEEYRRAHGHICDLKITKIDDAPLSADGYFDGEYYIEDLDALIDWITMNDGFNDGAQIGERKSIPDISLYCIERVVKRAPLTVNDDIREAARRLVFAVAQLRFERREPGSVTSEEWWGFGTPLQDAIVEVVENALKEES